MHASSPALTTLFSSTKDNPYTPPKWAPLIVMRVDAGLSTSYTITEVSNEPVAINRLSGHQATQFMRAVWYNMFFSFTYSLEKGKEVKILLQSTQYEVGNISNCAMLVILQKKCIELTWTMHHFDLTFNFAK